MKTHVIGTCIALAMAGTVLACPADKAGISTPVAVKSPGKAVAPIDVSHRLLGKPAVGAAIELELQPRARHGGRLLVEVNAAGLGLVSPLRREVDSGGALLLTLIPESEGRHYVNVLVRESGTNTAARVVSIPVQIGSVAVGKLSRASETPAGERIVRLPAR